MCLAVNCHYHKPDFSGVAWSIKTRKPVTVYKIVVKDGSDLVSMYYSFHYELGHEESSFMVDAQDKYIPVLEGFHAWRSLEKARIKRRHVPYNYDKCVIVQCVIPAGSRVFYGTGDEICSNRILPLKIVSCRLVTTQRLAA